MEIITKTDLEKFKVEMLNEIKTLFSQTNQQNPYVKSKEAQEILGCSSTKLELLRYTSKLPFKKIGGTVYYKRIDLNNLFENANE